MRILAIILAEMVHALATAARRPKRGESEDLRTSSARVIG